jgi:hypothetical protein
VVNISVLVTEKKSFFVIKRNDFKGKKAKIVNSINFHRHNRIQSCVLVFYNSLSIEFNFTHDFVPNSQ